MASIYATNFCQGKVIDVTKYGAIPNDSSDDIVGISSAIDASTSKSGGEGLAIELWHDCDRCVIEDNEIKNNEGAGIQFTTAGNLDQFSFINHFKNWKCPGINHSRSRRR